MSPSIPLACSLNADELSARVAEIGALGSDALRSISSDGALHFNGDADTRARLEAIIAAESHCCSFLRFHLREHAGELVLTISAPDGAESLARDLVRVFAARVGTA